MSIHMEILNGLWFMSVAHHIVYVFIYFGFYYNSTGTEYRQGLVCLNLIIEFVLHFKSLKHFKTFSNLKLNETFF